MTKFTYDSPIGTLFICVEGDVLRRISLDDFDCEITQKSAYKPVIGKVCNFLDGYFDGNPPLIDFDILPLGTEFQLKVWKELFKIPFGKTKSYKDIANKVFTQNPCPQAVGGAVGKNPILILIPCHRVLGADRSLTGFSAGLNIKRWLLNHEGIEYKE